MLKICCLPITDDAMTPEDMVLLDYVSPARRERVLKYRFDKDRKLSLYAALLARKMIAEMTGADPRQLTFAEDPRHKPYVIGYPDIHFNFSHTHGMVLCAVSDEGEVGADVEELRPAPLQVMRKVFHPEEIQYVLGDNMTEGRSERFFEIWTKKEAYTKYLGTGLVIETDQINTLDKNLEHSFLMFRESSYQMSVCSLSCNQSSFSKASGPLIKSFYKFRKDMIPSSE